MKLVSISATLFIENNKLDDFKKDFDELFNKYKSDDPNQTRNIDIKHIYELDHKEDRKYKPGQVYKITACKDIDMYLIIWLVSYNHVIGSFASINTLNSIKKSKNIDFDKKIKPFLRFMELDNEDRLLYDMSCGFDIKPDYDGLPNYQPIDDRLEFSEDLDIRIVDNISTKLRNEKI